jgi:methylated-DNA-[protein]-cysteine S-methyltransferase
MKYYLHKNTPVGTIGVLEDKNRICRVNFNGEDFLSKEIQTVLKPGELISEAVHQIDLYFEGKLLTFDFPVETGGTPFMQRVWHEVRLIPFGETDSYGHIAALAGSPGGARAAGMANNRNPLPLYTPCHRVIGSKGSLVGFGSGLPLKEFLLNHEKQVLGIESGLLF